MSATLRASSAPMSSGELPITDLDRVADVESKQARLAEFLSTQQLDAVLLQRPENFAWFTSGGNSRRGSTSDTSAALFLTASARVVMCHNTVTGQLFDTEIPGLGFQLKERGWQEPLTGLMQDLCRGRRVGSDNNLPGTRSIETELNALRRTFTPFEVSRLRVLGRNLVHAVEATARSLTASRTEGEIAGELSHRLLKHQMQPVLLQVWGDNRGLRHRQWQFSERPVHHFAVLTAVAERWGLHLGVSRTVAVDEVDESIRQAFLHATMLTATGAYFSQAGWSASNTLDRVRRIYEKVGRSEEWREAALVEQTGYRIPEAILTPGDPLNIESQTALWWHPSAGPAMASDSFLVQDGGFELLTPVESWPTIEVSVKETPILCPGILQR